MMKIKNLAAMALMSITTLFTSCGEEEYKQIYLYDTENKTRITNGSKLNLYCYREHKYIVRGGSGNYNINALEGGNIMAEWGQKDTLKLTANFPIEANINIVDDMNNSIDLGINVDYLTQRYRVDSVYSEIKGDSLRIIDAKDIEEKVKNAETMDIGNTYIFIYDDEENIQCGQLRITDRLSQVIANMKFKADPEVTLNTSNTTFQKIFVYDMGRKVHEYNLIKQYSDQNKLSNVKMTEDITNKFKNETYYDDIESVMLYYDLTDILSK